jgi:parallel beta-helix repeat protein
MPVQAGSSGSTLMVDDDGQAKVGNCAASGPASNAAYSTIQSAVVASHHDDTILVCPGDYTEALVIRNPKDNLSLRSVKPFQAHIWRPISLDGDIPLVHIKPGADGVSFVHFSLIFPTTDDCDVATAGAILIEGTNASIRGNRIRSDGPDQFYTCGYRDGIVVTANHNNQFSTAGARPADSSAPASALIGWNIVRDFQEIGILASVDTQARVTRNSVHFGHQNSTCNTTAATAATGPAGIYCFGFGIEFDNDARGTIDGNVVVSDPDFNFTATQSAGAAPSGFANFLLSGIDVGPGDQHIEILGNRVAMAIYGISLFARDGALVNDNYVSLNAFGGIDLQSTIGTQVRRNQVYNTFDGAGLFASNSSSGNLFKNNRSLDNSTDCEDQTSGSAATVANDWVNNVGNTSVPSGLCTPEL